jgi:hypothetical protein
MNNSGSMERTLTTKSIRLREISQWTAAATLVAAGSLALFSASTLEKLSAQGEVRIDFSAFQRMNATSLAFDHVEEQKLFQAAQGLMDKISLASAETLPDANTRFRRIRLKKAPKAELIAEASHQPFAPSALAEKISRATVKLSAADAKEISDLEKVTDVTLESQALAQVYRNLRSRFIAAAEAPAAEGYPADSVALARAAEAQEFDEIPIFDAADFVLPEDKVIESVVATAPEKPSLEKPNLQEDVVLTSSSSVKSADRQPEENSPLNALTAGPQLSHSELPQEAPPEAAVVPITSPGLDLVPAGVEVAESSQPAAAVSTQLLEEKQSTGPPEGERAEPDPKEASISSLQAKNGESLALAPSEDLHEYSSDVSAALTGVSNEEDSEEALDSQKSTTSVSTLNNGDYGSGVSKDDKGITINWSKPSQAPTPPESPQPNVYVGKPSADGPRAASRKSSAITLTQSSAQSNGFAEEPAVDTKKCETTRTGFEAFNVASENESLAICRRELSLEGSREGTQARWWESFENEGSHWPTLSYSAPNDASRVPLLSTASIRILSAVSKTNTHIGMGIVFGEVPKGFEVQISGRADGVVYLDAGMKPRDLQAESSGPRPFIFLNVEPGQPLLMVRNRGKDLSTAIPLLVKSGMATHLKISEPREIDLDLVAFDASSSKERRMENLTVMVIGQPGKMGITDKFGKVKIRKIGVVGEFPLYVDVLKNEKSYKNRFRMSTSSGSSGARALYFFDEKRVDYWLKQLAGGLSPYSGLIAGAAPPSVLDKKKEGRAYLKIGVLDKKSSLVPERYLLDGSDRLVSESSFKAGFLRYIGVQIPEGPAIPTVVDAKGIPQWSQLVYAQPGVINVVNPQP